MRHRSDNAQKGIVEALRAAGAWVWPIGRPLDLLVAYRGVWTVLEVKTGNGRLTPSQQKIIPELAIVGIKRPIVRTPEEALAAIGALKDWQRAEGMRQAMRESGLSGRGYVVGSVHPSTE
jgi:hypothetical protein